MPWTPPDYAEHNDQWIPPDYVSSQKDEEYSTPPIPSAVEEPKESIIGKAWDFLNKPTTSVPSKLASKVSEPLMESGENTADTIMGKAKLYGGAYLQSIGDVLSSLTSPLNLGLTVASGGAGAAAKAGLPEIASALELPGRVAGTAMVGHGAYKTVSGDTASDRLSGIAEAVLGAMGAKGGPTEEMASESAIPEALSTSPRVSPTVPTAPRLTDQSGRDIGPDVVVDPAYAAHVASSRNKLSLSKPGEQWTPPDFASEAKTEGTFTPEAQKARMLDLLQDPESALASKPENVNTAILKERRTTEGESPTGEERRGFTPPDYATESKPEEAAPNKSQLEIISQYKGPEIAASIDRKKQIPINPTNEAVRVPQESIDKLKSALETGKIARAAQDQLTSQERSARAGKIEGVTTSGLPGYYQQLGMLKGGMPKISSEIQLHQGDVDSLIDAVTNSHLRPFEKLNAKTGLVKLLSGKAPQTSEIKLIGQVFGKDLEDTIMLHGGLGAVGGMKNIINDAVNLPKSIMASTDLSAPLRQGLPFIHRPEYWSSFKDMFKYFGSEKAFQTLQDTLQERPKYDLGHENGLHLSNITGDLGKREEAFLSQYAEKIPAFGHLVRASDRAYTGFLNQLRANTFDNLIDHAKDLGLKPDDVAHEIANFVNTSTGRGSLGRLEKNAVELNSVLFSPRLIASRLTMLNPNYYVKMSPFLRKEALKSLMSVAAAGSTVASLGKLAGGTVTMDPASSDFGKVKFGNTRLDPYGGFQQYIVAAMRLLSGKETSVGGKKYDLANSKFPNPTRMDVVKNFGESKLSPIASFADTLLKGNQAFPPGGTGEAITSNKPSAEVINRFTPMLISDMVDLYKSNPDLLPLGLPAAFGMGLQTFEPSQTKSPFRLGMSAPRAPQ